ncbi:Predicted oxidoreductase [Pedobacter terrae]|uniref:Predicted oxidoreductase n=1 Tax=Pedobacter terrae TaxID=405671 RepID=A0A1G7XEQ6_9SPHI|nr:aldo/keto reductase [Pedobacter terrae]SDG82561.1 Predicted oxidoreductase [Pedobacter terrae]
MKYKLLGTHTGLQVSEVILGGAGLGERSGYGSTPEEALAILKAYTEAGGNFIDTSDKYQLGESEEIIGRFIKGQRQDFVISTKYTLTSNAQPKISSFGNHRKAMREAVDASLKRLQTDYIDIYMPHFDDAQTPWEEIARGLEELVKCGKVIYTGLTNFPAWKIALISSSVPLNSIQVEYNLLQRSADREFLPLAQALGLGTMLYSPLAGGLLTGKYRKGETGRLANSSTEIKSEDDMAKIIIDYLESVAQAHDTTPGQVAFAWALHTGHFPLAGPRKIHHLEDSLKATELELTEHELTTLNELSQISLGYPHDLLRQVSG